MTSLREFSRALLSLCWLAGCDLSYPEIVVVNRTKEPMQLRKLGLSGCAWDGILAYGEATAPGRCLPGVDRIHFERLDAAAYCRNQVEHGGIDGLCACDGGLAIDGGSRSAVPTWFNYQTLTAYRVDYGEFQVLEVTLDDMEQDFSVPGPYGH